MKNDIIGFIGGGNMTMAIASGLLQSDIGAGKLVISEPSPEQRERLHADLPDVPVSPDNDAVVDSAGTVVLAVKPQVLAPVCRDLREAVQRERPLVISIAAGVRSTDIDAWLGGEQAVVRIMPNQPALLGKGASGLFGNERAGDAGRERARDIMAAVGTVVTVPTEDDIDAVTAVSGSGPAYFFLLIDVLTTSGHELGLEQEAARMLAIQTALGAAAQATAADVPMADLIARVRSPGGTTAAALDSLESANVRAIFARAVTAARDRAITLADNAHQDET